MAFGVRIAADMIRYIEFADRLSAWFGKAFAWAIMVMTLGVGYEVVVRRLLSAPTSWAFDVSYIMYGTMFMMAGAYTLSRNGHVRGDFIYRLWKPRTQATVEFVLYFIFFSSIFIRQRKRVLPIFPFPHSEVGKLNCFISSRDAGFAKWSYGAPCCGVIHIHWGFHFSFNRFNECMQYKKIHSAMASTFCVFAPSLP